ncbi:hypothetical protein DPMN_139016 [Dreissena polymorpha]|uniref:Uncharacterized protein n=1 Tax=Dreissena polymorpha TaxID=45954 RepID=A0A9D4JKD8_DREPO|nr:hypothetical protein DPMN_139016 [Dreissena polymorpha]
MPCESFRDSNSLQKLQAVWAGKQAVEEYLRAKTEAPTPITCRCQKKISANTKPKPGGKLITSDFPSQSLTVERVRSTNRIHKLIGKRLADIDFQLST